MRRFAAILALLLAVNVRGDVLLVNWEESRDEASSERRVIFFLSPSWVVEYWKAEERRDTKSAIAALKGKKVEEMWSYAIQLRGELQRYEKENMRLLEPSPCGGPLELVSGTVDIDSKRGMVRVALKVRQDGKLGDFIGNGSYPIPQKPNKAPEPTPGAVTPRATEGTSK